MRTTARDTDTKLAAFHLPSFPRLLTAAFAIAVALFPAHAFAGSPSNKFDILNLGTGKKVGHASYTIDKTKIGYKVSTTFDVSLNSGGVTDIQGVTARENTSIGGGGNFTDVQYTYSYKVDDNGSFLSGYAESSGTQAMITVTPDKARTSVTIVQTQNKADVGSQKMPLSKPEFYLLPNYDPSGFQVLITAAHDHPQSGNAYQVVLPANNDTGQRQTTVGVAPLKSNPDLSGSLAGKTVVVKHYSMGLRGGKAEIYTDDASTLLEVIMEPLHAGYVRNGFILGSPSATRAP